MARSSSSCVVRARRRSTSSLASATRRVKMSGVTAGSPGVTPRSLLGDRGPTFEHAGGAARVDRFGRHGDALSPILGVTARSQRGGGVEEDDVPPRTGGAGQDLARNAGVLLGTASPQRLRIGPVQADVSRVELIFLTS